MDKSLWADPDSGKVTLGTKMVLFGQVVDKKLVIEFGEGWKEYLYDPKHPEFKQLAQSLNDKLAEAEKKKGSKGTGKFSGKGF